MLADEMCRHWIQHNPNTMVSWYLMAAWGYYHQDHPIISDGLFDQLAKDLLYAWDEVEHPHRTLITKEDLTAGSLLLPAEKYPERVVKAYEAVCRHIERCSSNQNET